MQRWSFESVPEISLPPCTFTERPAMPFTLNMKNIPPISFPHQAPSPYPLQPPSSPLWHPLLPLPPAPPSAPPPSSWLPIEILYCRGSQRDVVYLGWPIARAQMLEGGLSQWAQLCTWSPNKLWRSNSIFNLCCAGKIRALYETHCCAYCILENYNLIFRYIEYFVVHSRPSALLYYFNNNTV